MDYSEGIKKLMGSYLSMMKQAIDQKSYSDKTFRAQVTSVLGPNIYAVKYCGNSYTVSSYTACQVGEMVRVCAPCNNWMDLYVVETKTVGRTENLCRVPTTEFFNKANLIAEIGGELKRASLEQILTMLQKESIPAIEYTTKEW